MKILVGQKLGAETARRIGPTQLCLLNFRWVRSGSSGRWAMNKSNGRGGRVRSTKEEAEKERGSDAGRSEDRERDDGYDSDRSGERRVQVI